MDKEIAVFNCHLMMNGCKLPVIVLSARLLLQQTQHPFLVGKQIHSHSVLSLFLSFSQMIFLFLTCSNYFTGQV